MSITPTPSDNDDDFDIYADLPVIGVEKKEQVLIPNLQPALFFLLFFF